jgi:hypothetical protein
MRRVLGLAAFLFIATAAHAQERVQQGTTALRLDAVDIGQAETGQFVFYASFLDQFFKAISVTDPAAWTVFFDGEPVKGELTVGELRKMDAASLTAVFVMARDEKSLSDGIFRTAKEGVQRILNKLRPNTDGSAAVVYANSVADSGLARDHSQTATWFEDVKIKGQTPALYDGIDKALSMFPDQFGQIGPNRAIVVVSDGVDRYSGNRRKLKEYTKKLVSKAETLNVRILVIGIGYNNLDEDDLKRLSKLAKDTGGTYRQADDLPQLDQFLSHVEDELTQQQVVVFNTNTFEAKATGLKVSVKRQGNEYPTGDKILKLPEPKSNLLMYIGLGAGGLVGLLILFFLFRAVFRAMARGKRSGGPVATGPGTVQCGQCGNQRQADWKDCKYCAALPHYAKLKIISSGELNGEVFYIKDNMVNIGSAEGNHMVINDPSVSKRHAGIKVQDNRFELADFGSTNGVLVNGQRINKLFLKDGDTMQVGLIEIEFTLKS